MEKISVIMPVYNVEKYIKKSIESVINQTYENLEIIIIDDGTPDNSGKIADSYAEKDNRIKVIHKENGGISSARNVGLDAATGEYITFIDSDDIANSRQYERLYEVIKKFNVQVSFCKLQRFYENEEIKNQKIENEKFAIVDEKISPEKALEMMLMNNDVGNYVHTKMFKKELFDKIRFPEGKTYEDVATVYKAIDKANGIAYTNEKLYYYLIR